LATAWFVKHLGSGDPKLEPDEEEPEYFDDRADAGRRLAARLGKFRGENPIVIAVPRGGLPVGSEIARALDAPLDIVVVRKLGAPDQPELGIGAVVDGDHPQSVINDELVGQLGVSREYLRREVAAQLKEIHRRQRLYRGDRPAPAIANRTVILVDDGIATGGSMRAALRGLKAMHPRKLVLAVPVAPAETIAALRPDADELICIATPEMFYAVGQFYRDFHQVSDREVVEILESAGRAEARGA
ncbi:MAG TPA: phosphoribosyltransferase, partial [Candidatus Binataceae bacterium]|nr:phosphoribosyltransferase [Candidatus Binataceae bacterium]